jgi:selenide,water dikinase
VHPNPNRIFLKGGLIAGRKLFLSKPLGTGVIATAAKNDAAPPEVLEGVVQSMLKLNRVAAEVAQEAGASGATDITGFGLLRHAGEMLAVSGPGIALRTKDLPLLPGGLALAEQGHWSGGMRRNRRHVEATFGARGQLTIDTALPEPLIDLLFESETSGGLLFGVSPDRAAAVHDSFRRRGEPCWEIGEVTAQTGIAVA